MSYTTLFIHLVFSTKYRRPVLKNPAKRKIIDHIKENCKKKNIVLKSIGGYEDHLHCLISLGRTQNIAEVAKNIKGESSFWINKNKIIDEKFMWQDDYWAQSLAPSQMVYVKRYIENQVIHHRKREKLCVDEELNFALSRKS